MIISESKEDLRKEKYFRVLSLLNVEASNAGMLLIDSMASERANAFDWKKLITNNEKMNSYIKNNPWFIEDLYDISKRSLLKERVGFIIIDEFIEPCTINNISIITRSRQIINALITVSKVDYKDSQYLVQYEYDVSKSKVKYHMKSIDETLPKLENKSILKFFANNKLIINWNPSKQGIPLVVWKSFPKNTNFYDIAIEKAQKLNIINDIILDQSLNLMQKKQRFNSDMQSGAQDDIKATQEDQERSSYFDLYNDVNSMTTEEWASQIALYSPNAATLKEFRDTADWFEQDIKKHGKSIRDDDDDSAQKTMVELLSINRSATDSLELNMDQYETNLKILISLFDDKTKRNEITVKLPLRTIGKTLLENTSEIMGSKPITNGGENTNE